MPRSGIFGCNNTPIFNFMSHCKVIIQVMVPVYGPTPIQEYSYHISPTLDVVRLFHFRQFLVVKRYVFDVIIYIFLFTSKILTFFYFLAFSFQLRIAYPYVLLMSFSGFFWSPLFVDIIYIFWTFINCWLHVSSSQWPTFLPFMVNKSVYLNFNVDCP